MPDFIQEQQNGSYGSLLKGHVRSSYGRDKLWDKPTTCLYVGVITYVHNMDQSVLINIVNAPW